MAFRKKRRKMKMRRSRQRRRTVGGKIGYRM